MSQDEVVALKDKDGLRLEEIKKLLLEKVDLQSSAISQRDQLLAREREFRSAGCYADVCETLTSSDIRATLSRSGIDDVTQTKITELHQTNGDLSAEIKTLSEKLARAKDVRPIKFRFAFVFMCSSFGIKIRCSGLIMLDL